MIAKMFLEFCNERSEACVSFTNELTIGADGWAMIAPFGDFPSFAVVPQPDGSIKRQEAIQRIDREGATQMVNEFKSSSKGVRKFFSGRPIYVGHPDVPGIGAKYPDKSPKGVISDLAVREDGLYGLPVFTNEGSDLVENADPKKRLRYFSGRLADCEALDPSNGTPVFRPNLFISVGLTNKPHLPVQMLNEAADAALAEQTKNQKQMKKSLLEKIIGLCAKAGIELANAADEAAVEAALEQLTPKVEQSITFANEHPTLKSAVTARETEITKLKTERDEFRASFANERKTHVAHLLAGAVTDGRITLAETPTWKARLSVEANFANELEALGKLKPAVKTTSVTISRGDRKIELANAADRQEMVVELVNEEMSASKVDYDTAFARVQKKHPQLFEAMQQPKIGKK